jgi:hypothetical protein
MSAEKAAQAAALREQGMTGTAIAARMGISKTRAYELLNDPDGSKTRARKRQYDLECTVCGGRASGTTPSRMVNRDEPVCAACSGAHYATWSREAIILAIQEWADEHGGVPPSATDWNRHQAQGRGMDEGVDEWRSGAWPSTVTVQNYFGSWNAAIEAAGFTPTPSGHYGRDGEDPQIIAEIAERYRQGESGWALAKAYNCTPCAIYYRLDKAGVERRQQATRVAA